MRHERALQLKKLMDRASELVIESVEIEKISLDDADLAPLRKKAGDRAVNLSKQILLQAVMADIAAVDRQLDQFVVEKVDVAKRLIYGGLEQICRQALKEHACGWSGLSEAQQKRMQRAIDDVDRQIMLGLTGLIAEQYEQIQ